MQAADSLTLLQDAVESLRFNTMRVASLLLGAGQATGDASALESIAALKIPLALEPGALCFAIVSGDLISGCNDFDSDDVPK